MENKRLTSNFWIYEFVKKRDFGHRELTPEVFQNIQAMAEELQVIRDEIRKPIIVTSGFRSKEYNRRIGGAKGSFHLTGKAADIVINGMNSREIYRITRGLRDAKKISINGFGVYKRFNHFDIGTDYFRYFS